MRRRLLATNQLEPWAALNDVTFHGVKVSSNIISSDGASKGGGLVATSQHTAESVLLSIPRDLVLCKESIMQCGKTDKHLRQLLEALESFIQTPRKAIVAFLLYQMTISNPDLQDHAIGVKSPFTDYYCTLPKDIPLPTFLASEERELLHGTSLFEALEQKLGSMEKEFEILRAQTSPIEWCRKAWWDESTGVLDFDDWKLADAMYRSRALELPRGIGDAMVPVLDMANHAPDNFYNARFEISEDGSVLLLVREGKSLAVSDEVNINYGQGGASEMIFSYGFLEQNIQSARELFLDLSAPEDDPLRIAKMHLAKEAPGVRIFRNAEGKMDWESDFVWWICINEEDGLDFQVLQTTDGGRELQALWKGENLDPSNLRGMLMEDDKWDLFLLRATVLILERVERQGEELSISQAAFDAVLLQGSDDKKTVHQLIRQLRDLELELLMAAYGALEQGKQDLLKTSRTITEFLAVKSNLRETDGHEEEDFS